MSTLSNAAQGESTTTESVATQPHGNQEPDTGNEEVTQSAQEQTDKTEKSKYQEIIPSQHTLITSEKMLDEVLAQHLTWVNSVLDPKVDVPVGRANIRGSDLRAYSLKGVNLSGADLSDCDLRGVDLSAAILTTTNLRGALLQGANLTHAKLLRAKLDQANLTGADLTHALLMGCDLEKAILEEPAPATTEITEALEAPSETAPLEASGEQSAELDVTQS